MLDCLSNKFSLTFEFPSLLLSTFSARCQLLIILLILLILLSEEKHYTKGESLDISGLVIMPDNIRDKSQGKSELYQNIPLYSADYF